MALGKVFRLALRPSNQYGSCNGCWFYGKYHPEGCPTLTGRVNSYPCFGQHLAPQEDKIWVLEEIPHRNMIDSSRYPFPGNVPQLLNDLLTDEDTRQEIKDTILHLQTLQNETSSHLTAWECTVALHNLCWQYC